MTTGDMWSPILSCLGTTQSNDASSGSPHFVKMDATNSERRQGRECLLGSVLKVLFNTGEKTTRLLSDSFFLSLWKKDQSAEFELIWVWMRVWQSSERFHGTLPHDSLSYWFPPCFNRCRTWAKKSWRIPESSFLHHSAEWNLVCKCLTSFEASFTVSGALIQTTWRPASGYGPLQKNIPIGCFRMGNGVSRWKKITNTSK